VLTAAVLLPLVLLAVSSSTYAAMSCSAMGLRASSCCCPEAAVAGPANGSAETTATTSVKASSCCTVVQVQLDQGDSMPARAFNDATTVPTWALLPTGVAMFVSERIPPARHVPVRDGKPAHGGRAVLLAKRSFLI